MRVSFKTKGSQRVIEISDIGIDFETEHLWFYTLDEELYQTAKKLPSIAKAHNDLNSLLQLGFLELTDSYHYDYFVLLNEG